MFFRCSTESFNLGYELLKNFIASCHWTYFKRYNVFGHHGSGWGFAYIPEGNEKLIVKRDINPIYFSDWENLTKIKTRFLLVHARKMIQPWKKTIKNVHPINIGEKYLITHNGTINLDSFPEPLDPKLREININTEMDTRRYLCLIMDELKRKYDLKEAIESTLRRIQVNSAANAFLFNSRECIVIKNQKNTFNGRNTTLFLAKDDNSILVSTTPINPQLKFFEIPNNTLIKIDLVNLKSKISKLVIAE